jgi:hypothetical protein
MRSLNFLDKEVISRITRLDELYQNDMLDALTKKFTSHKDQLFELPLAREKKAYLDQLFQERLAHLSTL